MEARSHIVPYFDFRSAPASLQRDWREAMNIVIDSGIFIQGPQVSAFERTWADRVKAIGCVGVANGLDALTLALRALGLGPGDRVAVPAHTFIATWLAVIAIGAVPVAIDVDTYGLIDLDILEQLDLAVSAVIPVHLHGGTVDMERLTSWAKRHAVLVVEDCAQAHGAEVGGRPVGSWGDASAFSFYPTKNLGALGDAGAVTSNNQEVLDRVWTLANYGAERGDKYRHERAGFNSRLDPLQASVLNVNVTHLEAWTVRRREIAQTYLDVLIQRPDIGRPLYHDVSKSVWHHFVVMTPDRSGVASHLLERGIQTEIHYPRIAADEISKFDANSEFPVALENSRAFSRRGLSLPLHPWLSSENVSQVSDALLSAPKNRGS